MRINTIQTSTIKTPKKKARPSSSNAVFTIDDDAEHSKNVEQTQIASAPLGLESLLMLQENTADSQDERRHNTKQALQKADQKLDILDLLKTQLLNGRITKDTLHELSRLSSSTQNLVDNADMQEIMNQIDLRLHVELAKIKNS